jgi:hypothetical protein
VKCEKANSKSENLKLAVGKIKTTRYEKTKLQLKRQLTHYIQDDYQ